MSKFIGTILGFDLFVKKELPDDVMKFMEGKLNKPGEAIELPYGWTYTPFKKPFEGLTDKQKLILIKHAPDWTTLQLMEEIETMIRINNA